MDASADARLDCGDEAGPAADGEGFQSALAALITVVVATSPVPSDPDLGLIRTTMASVASSVPGCPVLVVCDGARAAEARYPHRGKVTPEGLQAYHARLDALEEASRRGETWAMSCRVLRLDEWHGFGCACQRALREVTTPLVLLVQHDMALTMRVELDALARLVLEGARAERGAVNCVVLKKKSQRHYRSTLLSRSQLDVGPPQELADGLFLTPLCHFYDSPHLAAVAWYRAWLDGVFKNGRRITRGQFTEVVSSEWLLDLATREGVDAALRSGLWLWEVECVTHIDGRRWLTTEMRKAKDYPEACRLRFGVPTDGSMCPELAAVVAEQGVCEKSPG